MAVTLPALLHAARLTVERPKSGARLVMSLRLSRPEGWIFVGLMAVVSTLLAELALRLSNVPVDPAVAFVFDSPFRLAALQLVVMGTAAYLITRVGRWAGGTGQFDDALVLMAWLQAILLLVQLAELVAAFVLPLLAGLIGIVAPFLFGWLLTNFTAELHGFASLPKVFFSLLAGFMAFSVALAAVLVAVLTLGA